MVRLLVVLLVSLMTVLFIKNLMASRALNSAVHSVVYVTVPNITVGKQIASDIGVGAIAKQLFLGAQPRQVTSLLSGSEVTEPVVCAGVHTTCEDGLTKEVVSAKLAACVNIVPSVTSVYEWEGKIEEESESLLIMKTKFEALNALKTKVLSLHPYKVPEFIATPIEGGSEKYLQWINEQVHL